MDYALAQLISDTADIRSAIRGHSLARDMYGNDAITQRLPHLRAPTAPTWPRTTTRSSTSPPWPR